MKINIQEDVFNPVYLPYINNSNRFQIYYGGAGSGKSVFCSQKILYSVLDWKTCNVLVVRKIAKTNRESTFKQIVSTIDDWGLTEYFNISQSNMTIKCTMNNNRIVFLGLDDVQKIKSITGICMIWIQEANQITQDDFKQLNLRLRGNFHCPFQILISFNPVTQNHWLKKHFFDNTPENTSILKTTYLDNKFIDQNYKAILENLKHQDINFYNIYCLGEWGQLGAVIYQNCAIEQLDKNDLLSFCQYIAVGLDWGFNDPSAALLIAVRNKDIYILDQIYVRKITRAELKPLIRQKGFHQYPIYADSAQPATITDYQNDGFNIIPVKKFPGSVLAKINQIKSMMIHVNTSCVNTIKQIQSYCWKLDPKTNTYLDQPIAFNDHCMDALRYAINFDFQNNIKGYSKGWCK